MFLSNILAYPEFLAVALLTVVLVRNGESDGNGLEAPGFLRSAGLACFQFFPRGYREIIARWQNWAGWRSNATVADFASIKLVLFFGMLALAIFIPLAAAIVLAAISYFLPDAFLFNAMRRRQSEIRGALPQALDLMVMCVDAGLGLDAALQRVANDRAMTSRALNEELGSLGRDILLGMDRARAYFELYKRTGVEELKMLGSALNQSTKLGLSIARILRSQSEFLRARQGQNAEERASKLPVWMAFPLWFCIMPALLFVIMGPSLITFMMNLGHVKPDWFN